MKAIILTYAPVDEKEKAILAGTGIYKIAINQHGSEYKPDVRIISDYVLVKMCQNFPEKIVSVRDKLRCPSSRVEQFNTEFKGATIISAIEYLIYKDFDEILVVGNNMVNNTELRNLIKKEVDKLAEQVSIYQYTQGNFNLPVKSITEFCK